jgi:hypothetical protein
MIAAQLASGADARQAAYTELLLIEAEHHLHGNTSHRGDGGSAVSIHVGGLEGPGLEDEKTPRVALWPFGTVLARSACAARSR